MSESTAVLDPRTTLEKAIEKGLDPVTIGKMMDLQERWEAGKARKEYVEAMAGFKRECPAVIGKDKRADFGQGKAKYSYATTGAIVTAITPALSKFGLSLSWETTQKDHLVTVTCHVTHSGGHRESASLTGPHDESGGKNPIQTLGSSVHYLQRYTMVSVLGLATADMDDPDKDDIRPAVEMPRAKTATAASTSADGTKTATGTLDEVTVKDGESANVKWQKFGMKVSGKWYSTFVSTVGGAAMELKGKPVCVAYTVNSKGYNDAVSISPATAKGADGTDRAALIEALRPLIDKATPQKEQRIFKAVGINTENDEAWDQATEEQLKAMLSMFRC